MPFTRKPANPWKEIHGQAKLEERGISFSTFMRDRWTILNRMFAGNEIEAMSERGAEGPVPIHEALDRWWPPVPEVLPRFLGQADIVMRGAQLYGTRPLSLTVRIQHVHLLNHGMGPIVPFCTDIDSDDGPSEMARLRLSIYGVLLRHNPPAGFAGIPVATWGVIQLGESDPKALFAPVRLLPEFEVVARVRERHVDRQRKAPLTAVPNGQRVGTAQDGSPTKKARARTNSMLVVIDGGRS